MKEARVPFFPRGRPNGQELDVFLTEVLVFAKVDLARTIEPSLTLDEQRQGLRPPDTVLLRRFTDRAARRITELAPDSILGVKQRLQRGGSEPRDLEWQRRSRSPRAPRASRAQPSGPGSMSGASPNRCSAFARMRSHCSGRSSGPRRSFIRLPGDGSCWPVSSNMWPSS